MRVQRVLMPGTGFESWTVLGEDLIPVESVERFLSYLASIEKSPNTIKAYAHDLKDWLTYLDQQGVDWRAARLEKLIAVVRPEFRIEVHLVDPDDPVLGRRQCAVTQCDRPVSENTLCSGHARRWRDRDRPGDRSVPRRPRSGVERPPGLERLHCEQMPIPRGGAVEHTQIGWPVIGQ